ncbi:hypothetical protein [Nocardia tengchongensis]
MTEASQVPMIFGPSGRDRGALCDLISPNTPGVGFVQITPSADPEDPDGNDAEELAAEIERVRAFHVTDDDIRWVMATFVPPRRYEGDTVDGAPVVIDLDEFLYSDGDNGDNGNGRGGRRRSRRNGQEQDR